MDDDTHSWNCFESGEGGGILFQQHPECLRTAANMAGPASSWSVPTAVGLQQVLTKQMEH